VAFLTISILEEGSMDRIDAIKVLLTAQDEGSLAAADRKVGQSPATVSRAMALSFRHCIVWNSREQTERCRHALCQYLPAVADRARRGRFAGDQPKPAPIATLAVTASVLTGEDV
jgi:hypothetical protein